MTHARSGVPIMENETKNEMLIAKWTPSCEHSQWRENDSTEQMNHGRTEEP